MVYIGCVTILLSLFISDKLWTAPEIMGMRCPPRRGTQKSDIYAFGIILYEIIGRAGPYGNTNLAPKGV